MFHLIQLCVASLCPHPNVTYLLCNHHGPFIPKSLAVLDSLLVHVEEGLYLKKHNVYKASQLFRLNGINVHHNLLVSYKPDKPREFCEISSRID